MENVVAKDRTAPSGQNVSVLNETPIRAHSLRATLPNTISLLPDIPLIPPSQDPAENDALRRYQRALCCVDLLGLPDLSLLQRTLDEERPWMSGVTAHVVRELNLARCGNGVLRFGPILINGPAGCGKTSFTRRLSDLLNCPLQQVSVGGSNSSLLVTGNSRGYTSARPSVVLEIIAQQCIANPLICFEELEKDGESTQNGRMSDAILQLLEPENARHWFDPYLLTPCDLSHVNYLATVNSTARIPGPLLDRFTVIEVGLPEPEHYPALIRGILKSVAADYRLDLNWFPPLTDGEWHYLERAAGHPRKLQRVARALLGLKAAALAKH